MKKLSFLCLFLGSWFLHGNEKFHQQLSEECMHVLIKKSPERLWVFNGQPYLQNGAGQWELARYVVPANFGEWLKDLARRGVCPKEHQGIYLDQSIYACGIWYCRGFMENGERCPYHIDTQFPNGIPRMK